MQKFHDQLGRSLELADSVNKIVCLVPSITELLYDLGLEEKIVGRTKFCVFDDHDYKKAQVVGGTKTVHYDKIKALSPNLIICNKEENTEEIVKTLEKDFPIYVSTVQTVHGALSMIDDLGKILDVDEKSQQLIRAINEKQKAFHAIEKPERKCMYLIWQKPFMSIGIDTFIYHMLQEMNFISVLRDFRYPEISEEEMKNSSAEFILLSDEPFPFGESHKKEIENKITGKKVILVDGSYFSWYGSRILKAYDYMLQLHQEL